MVFSLGLGSFAKLCATIELLGLLLIGWVSQVSRIS